MITNVLARTNCTLLNPGQSTRRCASTTRRQARELPFRIREMFFYFILNLICLFHYVYFVFLLHAIFQIPQQFFFVDNYSTDEDTRLGRF